MSFSQGLRARMWTRKFRHRDRPEAESPPHRFDLHGHPGDQNVLRVAAMPEGARIATACGDGHVRVFDARGDGDPLLDIPAHAKWVTGLAILDDHVLASASCGDSTLHTWDARTGERMDTIDVGGSGVGALAAVGLETLVAGLASGAVVFVQHTGGRQLAEVARDERAHSDWIADIAWHKDVMVTACGDKTARVWSLSTRKPLAVLREHRDRVGCAAVNSRYIETGSDDNTLCLYTNGAGFPRVCVRGRLHTKWIDTLQFIGSNWIVSGSHDDTMCFTAVSPDVGTVARLRTESSVADTAITVDGHVAWVGWDGAASISAPPSAVADAAKKHALATFHSAPQAVVQHEPPPPLQVAPADAHAGRITAASRRLNFRELEALALSTDEIRKLDVEQSSCLLAAAMVMFKRRYAEHYAVIERGVFRAFDRSLVDGESLVDTLDVDQAFRIVRSGLKDEGEYLAMEVDTRTVLEGRLRSYLVKLRQRAS